MVAPETTAESDPARAKTGARRWLRFLPALIAVALCAAAAIVLRRELAHHSFGELREAVRAIPPRQILTAVLLTVVSYTVLTGYDALALHTVGIALPYRKTIVASFLGYVFSHNVGLSILGGSAARFRMYSASGLTATDVVKVFAFCALTFWLGLLSLAGSVLIVSPELFSERLAFPWWLSRMLGALLVGATLAYVYACWRRRKPLRWRTIEFPLPRPALAVAQIVLSIIDWTVAASVLHALLPAGLGVPFPRFLGVYVTAQLIAVTSHVPGGIGVFESSVLWLLHDQHLATAVLGALLVYRMIYYLAPLALGVVLLAAHEAARHGHLARRAANAVGAAFATVSPRVVPRLLAFAAFWSGAVLLYSSATPSDAARMHWLASLLPLPLLEFSHFAASILGTLLLLLARGLHERKRAAWTASVTLLAAGIATALLKGLDWEEATLLVLVLATLVPCRDHFTRRSSLFSGPPQPGWAAGVAAAALLTGVLAAFSFKHVDYSHELWWRFSLHGDAPRALRATAGIAVVLVAFGLRRLLEPLQPELEPPTPDELEQARQLASSSDDALANLVLLGDKSILWSADGDGFVMFAVQGRSWIALGDPFGAPDEARVLVRRFRDMAHRHGGSALFHQVLDDRSPLYAEAGLSTWKLGEEARVALADFTLEGEARREVREACARLEQAGARFELVPARDIVPLLPELRRVSDEWLAARGAGGEQGFALGWFAPDYLVRFPIALVRLGGRVVAFANVWLHEGAEPAAAAGPPLPLPSREELAVDLLRHVAAAPAGTIDFLLARLMELGRARGFRWFNLGLAPLEGLDADPLAPLWRKLGGALFRHGEAVAGLAHFEGVRRWKARFDPVWRPRHLAATAGPAATGSAPAGAARDVIELPRVLDDLLGLVNRVASDRS